MGTSLLDDRQAAAGIVTQFYSSNAWIEGRAEDQLQHVSGWAGVSRIAAFPDLHPGKLGPVGCAVLADRVYPQLIGSDIGCGMALFALDLPVRKLKLDKAVRRIRVLGEPLDEAPRARLEALGLPGDLFAEALGTIGGGNHFCELQALADVDAGCDLDGSRALLLVHSGSRGLGAATLNALPQGAFAGLTGEAEAAYVAAHDQAVTWARLNRQIIAERAAEALRVDLQPLVDVPHNLLARMPEGWLHRKGAAEATAPLVPIAGTRATQSYLVAPLGAEGALASLAHGAGRRYDRASMHGRVRGKKSDLAAMGRNAFGGRLVCEDKDLLIEEAPQAYKSAEAVVADLEALGVARRRAALTPLLTFKKTRAEGLS
jgi:release factor H-coupled RctB family protein